jgi:lipoprotein-anchoring transpeptidase ErfK/SrfK
VKRNRNKSRFRHDAADTGGADNRPSRQKDRVVVMQFKLSNALINVGVTMIAGAALLLGSGISVAQASPTQLVAKVSLSRQVMEIRVEGRLVDEWTVSTGADGYATPKGSYRPYRMHEMWYSRQYDNAPMPHSVFFHEGYAIHATPHVRNLGQPASHGCVRLHPDHAHDFFQLVDIFGATNTQIVIVD